MNIQPIKSEQDYITALARLDVLFDSPSGSAESDEADILALMIDEYENKHFPIDAPDPITAIQIRMEELQLKQSDLVGIIGGKSRVSEILRKRRKLTLEMIRNIEKSLNIPADLLIKDYELVS